MRPSLRLLLVVIMFIVAVTAGIIAFLPLYNASMTSAESAAEMFSTAIAGSVKQGIVPFFSKAMFEVTKLNLASRFGDMTIKNNQSMYNWLGAAHAATGFSHVARLYTRDQYSVGSTSVVLPGVFPPDNETSIAGYGGLNDNGLFEVSFRSRKTFLNISPPWTIVTKTKFPKSAGPTSQLWANVSVNPANVSAVINAQTTFHDPNGTQTGYIMSVVSCEDVIKYLKTVAVAKSGRAVLVDSVTGSFIGGNFAHGGVKFVNGIASLLKLVDVTEPLISEAVTTLGMERVMSCVTPCDLDYGTGSAHRFVRLQSVTDDYGLNLRLIIVIPSDDFLLDIREKSAVSIGASAASIVGLVLISSVVLHYLLTPLRRLEDRLYASATLEDDGGDDGPSFVSEIFRMEVAYQKLLSELKKVKSYLPQSVLRQLEQQDSDDEGDVMSGSKVSMEPQLVNGNASATALQSRQSQSITSPMTPNPRRMSMMSMKSLGSHSTPLTIDEKKKRTLINDDAATTKRVTVVAVNMNGLHKTLQECGIIAVRQLLATVTEVVLRTVNESKGVLESMSGDHFIISFNASTNCANHGARAANVVTLLQSQLGTTEASKDGMRGVRVGVATGAAVCGIFGSDLMKRFSIIGNVLNHAVHLLRRTKEEEVAVLTNDESYELMHYEYEMRHVTMMTLPHTTKQTLISTLLKKRETRADEWMYELEQNANKEGATKKVDSFDVLLNKAFDALASGDKEGAKHQADQLPDNAASRKLKKCLSAC